MLHRSTLLNNWTAVFYSVYVYWQVDLFDKWWTNVVLHLKDISKPVDYKKKSFDPVCGLTVVCLDSLVVRVTPTSSSAVGIFLPLPNP